MTAGIVGLGLIGGSMAKAYSQAGHRVLGHDTDRNILSFAQISGAVSEYLTSENICECDIILIAIFPKDAAEFLRANAPYISKSSVVIDCCGTKENICRTGFELAEKYGFLYAGGHPMAGTHYSGFSASTPELFSGAPMVIVPPVYDDIELLDRIKSLLAPLGFGNISVTTASEHDKTIAFTSQLAHVVSNAYIKSPTAGRHAGFSAGSYRDMTRVAWLNPTMWAELFLENGENLVFEIDTLIAELEKYRNAIASGDRDGLYRLLDEGTRRKEEIDG